MKSKSEGRFIHSKLIDGDVFNFRLQQNHSFSRDSVVQVNEELHRSVGDTKYSTDELTIELGLFIDDALWIHFQKLYGTDADSELETYAFAIVNNIDALFRQSSLNPPIKLIVNYYEVMKIPPVNMSRNLHNSGDALRLLDLFCDYQANIRRNDTHFKRWDHALLFTGYDLYRNELRTIAGYAPVKGMCSETRSCTISEGLDFGAVFVVAHEMGHSLGMSHDGDNDCDGSCCIMSPSVGTGRTQWSTCSVQEFNNFIAHLDEKSASKNCLRTLDLRGDNRKTVIQAGQMYTLDEQCMLFHGECWKHELNNGQNINDVCKMVWCGNGEGIMRSAHPALEHSYCGHQMWCSEGKCVPVPPPEALQARNGDWSEWNDIGHGSCTSECTECQINGQIRLRRSTRLCNSPFAHNGGSYCSGDDVRGIRCQQEKCNGSTIEEFATEGCTKLRDSGDPSTKNLTGKGMQYVGDLCKIWCILPHEKIRTIANFPDGTPCGTDSYCIKGRCRKLDCNGRAVVETPTHCPPQYSFSEDDFIRSHKRVQNTLTYRKSQHPYESWGTWSEWSDCTASGCRQQGIQQRERNCIGTPMTCNGSRRQRKICYGKCAEDEIRWSTWSQCSASCGFGIEQRFRLCSTCTDEVVFTDTRTCFLKECKNDTTMWSSWESWEQCNCTTGYRQRRRNCLVADCEGPNIELMECDECNSPKSHTSE